MNNALKKYLVAGVLVVAIALYFVFNSNNGSSPAVTPSPTPSDTGNGTTTTPSPSPSPTPTPTPSPTPAGGGTSGQYKDGTYNGSVTDAFYGSFQVAAVISGGKLTDVKFLKYPNDQGESIEVNSQSNPVLKQEAIAAQSANVNIVSGATQSSEAFQQSLAVALTQAKN